MPNDAKFPFVVARLLVVAHCNQRKHNRSLHDEDTIETELQNKEKRETTANILSKTRGKHTSLAMTSSVTSGNLASSPLLRSSARVLIHKFRFVVNTRTAVSTRCAQRRVRLAFCFFVSLCAEGKGQEDKTRMES